MEQRSEKNSGLAIWFSSLPVATIVKKNSLEAQLMERSVKICKTVYFSQYKFASFLFRFCMERANSLMRRNLFFVCQRSALRVMEILRVAY